eukprot:m.87521 g.87521  ORF g.87521 m.87521 type:complete len:174 (-) comp50979_c0_seq5:36-557(-)
MGSTPSLSCRGRLFGTSGSSMLQVEEPCFLQAICVKISLQRSCSNFFSSLIADGYILTPGDRPDLSVWALIANQRNRTLTNSFNSYDAVALRHPLASEETVIAPDLLSAAGEAGMEVNDFDSDVAAFLEGGVSVKELVRRRSQKAQSTRRPSGREANPCMLLCCLLLSVSDLV